MNIEDICFCTVLMDL